MDKDGGLNIMFVRKGAETQRTEVCCYGDTGQERWSGGKNEVMIQIRMKKRRMKKVLE